MILNVGDIIKTSYGTGPYEILKIVWECTCPAYLSDKPTKKHIHLVLCTLGDKRDKFYLNQYDGGTLESVTPPYDKIIVIQRNDLVQLSLF